MLFILSALFTLATALPSSIPNNFTTVAPGIYSIRNSQSDTYLHTTLPQGPLYVSNVTVREPFMLWEVAAFQGTDSEGTTTLRTIRNVGTRAYTTAEPRNGAKVSCSAQGKPTVYVIAESVPGTFTIQAINDNGLWNAESPVFPDGEVKLRPYQYEASERWIFTAEHL